MQIKYTAKQIEQFWGKVKKTDDPNECWIWQGSCSRYGYIRLGKHSLLAHRVSYEITFGSFDQKLEVLHKCDNPPCVNPNHLFLGTQLDNMHDMIQKGRVSKFENRHGEKSSNHKLTDAQVFEIRERYSSGEKNQRELGEIYGVDQTQISHIVLRKQRA